LFLSLRGVALIKNKRATQRVATTRKMLSKYKIAVLGIGGVGGYFGGKLAAYYLDSDKIEVSFIARGVNEKTIKSNGLKLITSSGEQVVHPSIVTSRPQQLGLVDLIVCCVKSYDLDAAIKLFKSCINENTVILPLLNGVEAPERIKKIFPQTEVWDGCVYTISRLVAPGVVKETGNISQLYFGSAQGTKEKLKFVESIFSSAGINVHLSDNIIQNVWEKYLFISTIATLTSYLDLRIGDILSNKQNKELLLNLLTELKNIADAKNVIFSENIIQRILDKMSSLPYETTSSMHDDFQKGNKTEIDSLTAYVIKLGGELNIPTPYYEKMFLSLKEKLLKYISH